MVAISGGATMNAWPLPGCSESGFGEAVNRACESHKGGAIKDEIDADREPNEIGAGCGPNGQEVDAEKHGGQAGEDGPSPPGKLHHTRPGCAEHSSNDEEGGKEHSNSSCPAPPLTHHQASYHPPNN